MPVTPHALYLRILRLSEELEPFALLRDNDSVVTESNHIRGHRRAMRQILCIWRATQSSAPRTFRMVIRLLVAVAGVSNTRRSPDSKPGIAVCRSACGREKGSRRLPGHGVPGATGCRMTWRWSG